MYSVRHRIKLNREGIGHYNLLSFELKFRLSLGDRFLPVFLCAYSDTLHQSLAGGRRHVIIRAQKKKILASYPSFSPFTVLLLASLVNPPCLSACPSMNSIILRYPHVMHRNIYVCAKTIYIFLLLASFGWPSPSNTNRNSPRVKMSM